jgi:3-phosphoshikimate 1-carboxyvinyltransferase
MALRASVPLDVGESGTLARLATALVAFASAPGERWTIRARGSLLFRKSAALFQALASNGVRLAQQNLPGTWPVELVAAEPPEELELARPQSSQEVSALLIALAAHPGTRTLVVRGTIPSEPYLAMTERLLARFHAEVLRSGTDDRRRFSVRGPLVAPGSLLMLEPDASSAAVVLAAACLSGGEVRVPGLGRASLQGDVRVVEHLAAFGCDARCEDEALSARGYPTRAAELDLAGEPDLAPVLAVVAAAAARAGGGTSFLRGLGTLPGKESDRLGGLVAMLGALGYEATAGADLLAIGPGTRKSFPEPLDPRADHRMVFAGALLGLLEPGVRCRSPQVVAKSWTSFWGDLEGLGARVRRT